MSEDVVKAGSLKRKRLDSLGCDNTEKKFAISGDSSATSSKCDKSTQKKRKFQYKVLEAGPKKYRNFYYLSSSMTKSRKLKTSKQRPMNVEQNRTITSNSQPPTQQNYRKVDWFCNNEKVHNYESLKKKDFSFSVVDEIIALEGLEGITLEAVWNRFESVFPCTITKGIADRLWRTLCNNKGIGFYILPEPRQTPFTNKGTSSEPVIEQADTYQMTTINEAEIRGSCSTYHTRKENNALRRFTLEKAKTLYNQRLVFVADQSLREKALISEESDPNLDLVEMEYCMLEAIGKCRERGVMTQQKMGIADKKAVSHYKTSLVQNQLIVNQYFHVKTSSEKQKVCGGLLHLSRFSKKVKTKQVSIMEELANILRNRPNYQMEMNEIQDMYGSDYFMIKLTKSPDFRQFFKVVYVPYKKLYPNSTHKFNKKEKQARLLRMIDPSANINAFFEAKNKKIPEPIDETPGKKSFNCEYLRDVFTYLLMSGPSGLTLQEINDYFKMDYYSIRMIIRKLVKRNIVAECHKIDIGRQKSRKFFAKYWKFNDRTPNATDYSLSQEMIRKSLKGYEKLAHSPTYEPEVIQKEMNAVPVHFTLNFDPFLSTNFMTETVDSISEEQTIYNIVLKGRDRLLLIQSNLFAHYVNAWDDFVLKKESFFKFHPLFHSSFGKLMLDFLLSVTLNADFDSKSDVIVDSSSTETKICLKSMGKINRSVIVPENNNIVYSDHFSSDTITKLYLFQAMFNSDHITTKVMEQLKYSHSILMAFEGKIPRIVVPVKKVCAENEPITNMEKCLGPNPNLFHHEKTHDGVEVKMYKSAPTRPNPNKNFHTSDINYSERFINRANLILQMVREHLIVKGILPLFREILKSEVSEGYDKKMCKKSVDTILTKLVQEGFLKVIKVVVQNTQSALSNLLICMPEIGLDHHVIKSTADQSRMKLGVRTTRVEPPKIKKEKKQPSPFSTNAVKSSILELKQMSNQKINVTRLPNKHAERKYGYLPKFARIRVLHEFLYYTIRDLNPKEQLDLKEVNTLLNNAKIEEELHTLPPIYMNEISWRMFIPPLPQHSWPEGWALLSNLILRMPLSIFVQIVNVKYDLPELEAFLANPLHKNYLLKFVPEYIRNVILYRRRYLTSIYESLTYLCYMGLLQLGPRNYKEKDQMFIYLNRKASLLDTCSTKPGFKQIEKKKYPKFEMEFKNSKNVDFYWSELLRVCMNTRLGIRKEQDQPQVVEDCATKATMVATLAAKTIEQAVEEDNGVLPGDLRGSAGFDSSLCTYHKRNWMWSTGPPLIRYSRPTVEEQKESPKKGVKRRKPLRVRSTTDVRIRHYYDAVDKKIMQHNRRMRVEWCEEEDYWLRCCRLASAYLCPFKKRQTITVWTFRDVLHRIMPKSANKTSTAIKRRLINLENTDISLQIMENNLDAFSNSTPISNYFEQVRSRYKRNVKLTQPQIDVCFLYLLAYIAKHKKEVELILMGCVATVDFFSKPYRALFEKVLEAPPKSILYSSVESTKDIVKDKIKTVVHCSIISQQYEGPWHCALYQIYSKFEDDLIRTVIGEMKAAHFICHYKMWKDGSNTSNTNWHIPFKFSQPYKLMGSGRNYTNAMFVEAYRKVVSLLDNKESEFFGNYLAYNELSTFWPCTEVILEIPEMGIILNPELNDHNEVIEELAKRFRFYLVKIHETNVGKLAAIQNEEEPHVVPIHLEQIKTHVMHMVFRVPYLLEGNLDSCFKKILESVVPSEINHLIVLMIVDLKKFALFEIDGEETQELKAFIESIDEDECVGDQRVLIARLAKVVFAIQNVQKPKQSNEKIGSFEEQFKQWIKQESLENTVKIKEVVHIDAKPTRLPRPLNKTSTVNGMEVCVQRAQAGNVPSLQEIREGMMVDAEERQIPHITDLIMLLTEGRFPELDSNADTIEKNHFIIQYPVVKQLIVEEKDLRKVPVVQQLLNGSVFEEIQNKIVRCTIVKEPECMDEKIVDYLKKYEGGVGFAEDLLNYIRSKQELGASSADLKSLFLKKCPFELADFLLFLCEINVLLRAGVSAIVFVHYEYKSNWIIEIPNEDKEMLTDERDELLKIQLKPWIKVNGTLYEEVFKDWLCLIFSYCLDFPRARVQTLCEQFQYIKPIDIYFLLEVLQELHCVELYCSTSSENSLFSDVNLIKEVSATILDSFEDTYVRINCAAGLSFGCFLNGRAA